jgi:hypothetical protein
MQVAHIASGQGRARRVDDRRAVVLLCPLVHSCHVSDADRFPFVSINGESLPTIDERHTLYVKRVFDAKYFDMDFLKTIWIGVPPEPERPPEYWCKQMYANQGVML